MNDSLKEEQYRCFTNMSMQRLLVLLRATLAAMYEEIGHMYTRHFLCTATKCFLPSYLYTLFEEMGVYILARPRVDALK